MFECTAARAHLWLASLRETGTFVLSYRTMFRTSLGYTVISSVRPVGYRQTPQSQASQQQQLVRHDCFYFIKKNLFSRNTSDKKSGAAR